MNGLIGGLMTWRNGSAVTLIGWGALQLCLTGTVSETALT